MGIDTTFYGISELVLHCIQRKQIRHCKFGEKWGKTTARAARVFETNRQITCSTVAQDNNFNQLLQYQQKNQQTLNRGCMVCLMALKLAKF